MTASIKGHVEISEFRLIRKGKLDEHTKDNDFISAFYANHTFEVTFTLRGHLNLFFFQAFIPKAKPVCPSKAPGLYRADGCRTQTRHR